MKILSEQALRNLARKGHIDKDIVRSGSGKKKPKQKEVVPVKKNNSEEYFINMIGEMQKTIDMEQAFILQLINKIEEIKQPVPLKAPTVTIEQPKSNWVFTVERNQMGMISKIYATRK